jgi:hypothetical protein
VAKAPIDLRSLARAHTEMCLRVLAGIALRGTTESARVTAAAHILDRGWGKAPQAHTGEDGDGPIKVVIRHILHGRDAGELIEQPPVRIDGPPHLTLVPIDAAPDGTGEE